MTAADLDDQGPSATSTVDPVMRRRALTSSVMGTCIEWFDFYVYGVAAATVLNAQFFPDFDPFVGILAAFATYAVGFAARPLGGFIFSHYGDRLGRKTALMVTLGMMGVATMLVGFLPNYAQIGVWAPVLLVLLRIIQGIGVGGEWGGAALMATEYAPPTKRGLFGSLPQIGVPCGTLLANGAFYLVGLFLTEEQMHSWGWRIPFIASILLVAISFYIRVKVAESPAFIEVKEKGEIADIPVLEAIKSKPVSILKVIMMRVAENGNYYIYTTFLLAYAPNIMNSTHTAASTQLATMIIAGIGICTIPMWGWISDTWGRRWTVLAGALTMLVTAFPFFWAIQTNNWIAMLLALILIVNIGWGMAYAIEPAYFTELFEPRIRYSGASIGPQVAAVFAGGFAPLIATSLVGPEWDRYWLVALYMMLLASVTVIGALWSPETAPKARVRQGKTPEYDPIGQR